MEKVKDIFYRCASGISVISAVGYILIVCICVFDVLLDKLFGSPIPGTYELIERCMATAVFASFAYTQVKKGHINMMVVIERLPRALRLILLGLVGLLSAATAGYAGYAAWTQTGTSMRMGYMTSILSIPLWPFYLLQTITLYLFAIVLLLDMLYIFVAIKSDKINEIVIEDYGMVIPEPKVKAGSE